MFYKINNKEKTILSLCSGTGAWEKPYVEVGYTVIPITLPDNDITRTFFGNGEIHFGGKYQFSVKTKDVYGILAAPPCTMFSFARTKANKPRDLESGMSLVIACLKIIWACQYRLDSDTQKKPSLKFWALENPNGMLSWFLGKPVFVFNPYEFGDNYKKKTNLWGLFSSPIGSPAKPTENHLKSMPKFDKLKTKEIHGKYYGKLTRQERRAITPAGFAKAFYEANK